MAGILPKISTIQLTSYFEGTPRRDALDKHVMLNDVYMPPGISPPPNGLTTFFGNTAARQLSMAIKTAEARGLRAWPVILSMKVRPVPPKRFGIEDIKACDVVNMDLLNKHGEDYVQKQMDKIRELDGLPTENNYVHYDRFSTRQPQRLSVMLSVSDVFRGVGIVIYNVVDHDMGLLQYATIFNRALISTVTTLAGPDICVTIPDRVIAYAK